MEDIKCPRCGAIMNNDYNRHYWYCFKYEELNKGCNTLWAKSIDCFFNGVYVLNSVGEIISYKQNSYEGGKIIKTDKLLSKYRGWELH